MPELFTALQDSDLGRAATHNAVLQQIEDNVLAISTALIQRVAWTTLSADASSISINVGDGDAGLRLMLALRTDRAGSSNDSIRVRINGDTGSTYQTIHILSTGPASSNYSITTGFQIDYGATGATASSGLYAYTTLRIARASASAVKPGRFETVWQGTTGSTVNLLDGALWYPTANPITSLLIVPVNGTNFVAGSQYALYGTAGL